MDVKRTEGVSRALLEWARGFDPDLKLNVTCDQVGDRSLITSSAVAEHEYIDGTKDKRLDFALVLVEPWSEGSDTLNQEALELGEAWLDWVQAQDEVPGVPGAFVEVAPDDLEPYVVMVMSDSMTAKYQFQAHLIYRS